MSRSNLAHGQIDPRIVDALDATGLQWYTVVGKKHRKVFLVERLVLVVAHGSSKREYQRSLADKAIKTINRVAEEVR